MWDPTVYGRYGRERSRPFHDLAGRIGAERPRAVADLGCGPGDLTLSLAARWPAARIDGVDSSPAMIERAAALGSGVSFRVGDVRAWSPGPDTDVLITNATLQWVPEHRELLDRWVTELPAGAWLAMQVPGNFDAPSHRLLREVARDFPELAAILPEGPGFSALSVGPGAGGRTVDDAPAYADRLTAHGCSVDAWETTYVHLLPVDSDEHPVLRWMEGTALRPVRAVLDDATWDAFRAGLRTRLAAAYPAAHGVVAFPFRRIFVVARTPSPQEQICD